MSGINEELVCNQINFVDYTREFPITVCFLSTSLAFQLMALLLSYYECILVGLQ